MEENNNSENLTSENINENDNNSILNNENVTSESQENDEDQQPTTSTYANRIHNQNLEEFREELRLKREIRINALSSLKNEIQDLKSQLDIEKAKNRGCKCNRNINYDNIQLADVQLELQLANAEILSLTTELDCTRKQVKSLKEVVSFSKKMVDIREEQVQQLKSKIKEIEDSLCERELKIMSDDLRKEYNRQLENIKNLKSLYEERARVSGLERDNLKKELTTCKSDLNAEIEKSKNLTEDLEKTTNELNEKQSQLNSSLLLNKKLQSEMATINELSTQILTGFKSRNNINIDKLKEVLEENRGLLTDMTIMEDSFEGASVLPKMLFDLVVQADKPVTDEVEDSDEELNNTDSQKEQNSKKITSSDEIVMNLPKVWRILMEFVNHQRVKPVKCTETDEEDMNCFKSIQTPKGPEVVISVSKTFLKLRDLILEKKSLQKETNRLKTLNGHLDKRLKTQENRLGVVSFELTKTWHLVGKMQRQHRQLHTNEQILRYQLQQKRRMLTELKEELEYCRKKWAQAREKNNDSEDQWRILKREFASRKLDDGNNSAESGYDEQNSSDDNDVESDDEGHEILKKNQVLQRSNSFSQTEEVKDHLEFRRGNSEPTEFYEITVSVLPASVDAQETHTSTTDKGVASPEDLVITTTTPIEPVPGTSKKVKVRKVEVKRKEETAQEMFMRLFTMFDEPKDEPDISSDDDEEETCSITETNEKLFSKVDEENRVPKVKDESNKLIKVINIDTKELNCDKTQNETSNLSKPQTENKSNDLLNSRPSCSNDVPSTSTNRAVLTEREEEYTSKRAERLRRLEEQCKQLMSKASRTVTRGDEISTHLDNIHERYSTPTRERGSPAIETPPTTTQTPESSDTEKQPLNSEAQENTATGSSKAVLTAREEEYTSRRAARIKGLEEQCKQLFSKVSNTVNRGNEISSQLDSIHDQSSTSSATADANIVDQPESSDKSNFKTKAKTQINLNETQNSEIPAPPPLPPPITPQNVNGKPFLHLIEQKCIERRFQHLRRLEERCGQFSSRILSIVNKYDNQSSSNVSEESSTNLEVRPEQQLQETICDTNETAVPENIENSEDNITIDEGYSIRRATHLQRLEEQCLDLISDIADRNGELDLSNAVATAEQVEELNENDNSNENTESEICDEEYAIRRTNHIHNIHEQCLDLISDITVTVRNDNINENVDTQSVELQVQMNEEVLGHDVEVNEHNENIDENQSSIHTTNNDNESL